MTISTNTILYEKRDGVGYITINRPDSIIALNRELSAGLRDALAEIRMTKRLFMLHMTKQF